MFVLYSLYSYQVFIYIQFTPHIDWSTYHFHIGQFRQRDPDHVTLVSSILPFFLVDCHISPETKKGTNVRIFWGKPTHLLAMETERYGMDIGYNKEIRAAIPVLHNMGLREIESCCSLNVLYKLFKHLLFNLETK